MEILTIILFTLWVSSSAFIAYFLSRKFAFFKGSKGVLILFGIFIGTAFLHNIVSGLLKIEEAVFFFLSIFSFGVMFFLIIIQLYEKVKKLTNKK